MVNYVRLGGCRTAAVSALLGVGIVAVFEGTDWVADEWYARFASRTHYPGFFYTNQYIFTAAQR
jgi:hypothetical protein